jgi:hypothetical protein
MSEQTPYKSEELTPKIENREKPMSYKWLKESIVNDILEEIKR